MENYEVTEKFKEMGYVVSAPTKDRTYYLVKHTKNGCEQIFIKLTKKKAEVEAFLNNKKVQLNKKLAQSIQDIILVYYQDITECIFL